MASGGNAVMRAKRTTGPTPNVELCIAVACETCDKCGATRPVRSLTRSSGAIVRICMQCIAPIAPEFQDPSTWTWTR